MSEFGRGFATALIQFTNHRARLVEDHAAYARFRSKHLAPEYWSERQADEMWANGASDHLAELVRPLTGITDGQWQVADIVATRAFGIARPYYKPINPPAPGECADLLDAASGILMEIGVTTLDEALAWDIAHGIDADRGDWACPEDISRAKSE